MVQQQPSPQSPLQHRYLRVQDLRRLRDLVFAPRRPVEGQYSGRHASRQRGHSVEFTDYREYTPGDEVGSIDWKVYGRSDRLFIKLFEHQSDMTVNLLVDASASMSYTGGEEPPRGRRRFSPGERLGRGRRQAGGRPSKYDHACMMAGAIAFLVTRSQDRIALGVAREGLRHLHPPLGTFGHLNSILNTLEEVRPRGVAGLAEAIQGFAAHTGRKGVLVLLSDLLEDREEILRAFSRFTHRGSEVIVFHVLHADELQLPDLSEAVFVDSETRSNIKLNVDDIRSLYEGKLRDFLDGWSTSLAARGIDYNLVSTDTPYNTALERYLFSRASKT